MINFILKSFRQYIDTVNNLSCYLKNMAKAYGQNKQADLEFKTNTCYRMDALGQDALNQAAQRFYHFAI